MSFGLSKGEFGFEDVCEDTSLGIDWVSFFDYFCEFGDGLCEGVSCTETDGVVEDDEVVVGVVFSEKRKEDESILEEVVWDDEEW